MAIKKQVNGHGDPLLMEVMTGFNKTCENEPEMTAEPHTGERCVYHKVHVGDALFQEAQRYHHAEDAHDKPRAALHETLMQLKRNKNTSLFTPFSGALYDPILHEFVLPKATANELRGLYDDVIRKRQLFRELSARKRRNLDERELLCDPLVHRYHVAAIMFGRTAKTPFEAQDVDQSHANLSKYRKLNAGDQLFHAATKYGEKKVPPVPVAKCVYRKIAQGDALLRSAEVYNQAMNKKSAVPCVYRKINAGDELLDAVME